MSAPPPGYPPPPGYAPPHGPPAGLEDGSGGAERPPPGEDPPDRRRHSDDVAPAPQVARDLAPVPYQLPPGGYGAPPPPHAYGYAPLGPPPAAYGPPPPHYGYPPPPANAYGVPHPGYGYPPPAYGYPPPPGYPPYGYPPPPGYPHYAYPPPPAYLGYPGYAHPGRSRSRSPDRRDGKFTCRFFIGIDNDDEFRVARRIIGANGSKMKEIVAKSGGDAKLRLRGKGSGYVERDSDKESSEPIQLCISCPTHEGYTTARRCTEELLMRVYNEYDNWCADKGKPHRAPQIHMTERHHQGDAQSRDDRGSSRGRRRGGARARNPPAPERYGGAGTDGEDRGTPPPNAPQCQEIERSIQDRNEARRRGDFGKADQIRDSLKSRGVVLSDEKGGHGSGLMVTQWRYWHD